MSEIADSGNAAQPGDAANASGESEPNYTDMNIKPAEAHEPVEQQEFTNEGAPVQDAPNDDLDPYEAAPDQEEKLDTNKDYNKPFKLKVWQTESESLSWHGEADNGDEQFTTAGNSQASVETDLKDKIDNYRRDAGRADREKAAYENAEVTEY